MIIDYTQISLKSVGVYAKKLHKNDVIMSYNKIGTMGMADYTNYMGELPVKNFSTGQQVDINSDRHHDDGHGPRC